LRSHRYIRVIISLILTALFLFQSAGWLSMPFLSRLENLTYDVRLLATLKGGIDHRVVIVDLDERSLTEEGRWPWGRDKLARLVNTLFDHYYIRTLGFDMVFAEPDTSSGLPVLERLAKGPLTDTPNYITALEQLRPQLQYDQLFAESLRDKDVILGYTRSSGDVRIGKLPPPLQTLDEAEQRLPLIQVQGYNANLPELQDAAYGAGFFDNRHVDIDGVYRRAPLVYRYGNELYESLSLALVRGLYGQLPLKLGVVEGGGTRRLEWLNIGDNMKIPVDDQGMALIPYRGHSGSFPYISATDILNKAADPKALDGAIVLLGTTAPGLMDMRSTPVQNTFPGVEVHANLIAGMLDHLLDQTIMHHPGYTQAADLLALLVIGLLLSLLLPRLTPLRGGIFSITILVTAVGTNLYFWQQGYVLPLASQLLLFFVLVLFHNFYGFFVEARGKHRLGQLFGQYVPSEIVDEMNREGGDFGVGGESREMTVLFSDICNFTPMSEKMEPDELTRMMNAYFGHMTEIIQRHRGTIDKYIGDAIMAFWGAPLPDPMHPEQAVLAALEMSSQMHRVRASFKERGWPEINIGIGINTGIMNVGNMGSEFRMTYTVLGDAVNLGARLEGLTRQYGVDIVVSEFTRAATETIEYRELDRVQVKGKQQLVTIYEPIGLKGKLDPLVQEHLAHYREALASYHSGNWIQAKKQFSALSQIEPEHKLYSLYLERIDQQATTMTPTNGPAEDEENGTQMEVRL
jgi:adenylate cyclase